MNSPPWLSALFPIAPCRLEPLKRGSDVLVWHATLSFVHWSPDVGRVPTRKETYGKTMITRVDGSWTVAEIELVRRLRDAGWHAGWMDTFGFAPKEWAEWLVKPSSLPSALGHFISEIERATGRNGGKPDLVAWRGNSLAEAVFIEYKGSTDRINQKQMEWLQAAFRVGMSRDQFAVAAWLKQSPLGKNIPRRVHIVKGDTAWRSAR